MTTTRITMSALGLGAALLLTACGSGSDGETASPEETGAADASAACEGFFATSDDRPDGYESLRDRVESELAQDPTAPLEADQIPAMRSTLFQITTLEREAPEDVSALLTEIAQPFQSAEDLAADPEADVTFETDAALAAIDELQTTCDAQG